MAAAVYPMGMRVPARAPIGTGLVLATLSLAGIGIATAATLGRLPAAPVTPANLPAAAAVSVSQTVGREDERYHARVTPAGVRADNPAHALRSSFGQDGVAVDLERHRVELRLAAAGRGRVLEPVGQAVPVALDNRVEYRRPGLTEWYLNGPLGLEQGFTLHERPAGPAGERLTLAVALGTRLVPRLEPSAHGVELVDAGGRTVLSYTGLFAVDADSRELPATLELEGATVEGATVLVRVDDAGARYPITIDPFVQADKLLASDGASSHNFGVSVALDGDTLVVGSLFTVGATPDARGAAYVFTRVAGSWVEIAKLTASDGEGFDMFGFSVAIDGDVIVVGAWQDDVETAGGLHANQGSAYVFEKPAGGWTSGTETAHLVASDGEGTSGSDNIGDGFGTSVAVSGDAIVVGAPQDDVAGSREVGSAHVFTRGEDGWSETAKLLASDGITVDHVGIDVAIDDATIVVGASLAGSVYVYERPPDGWASGTETARLSAAGTASFEVFGISVDVQGDTVVVGAWRADFNRGAAYVFVEPAEGWAGAADITEAAKLTASDAAFEDALGYSVALDGDTIVVGAYQDDHGGLNNPGSAYVFRKPVAGWSTSTETQKLTAADAFFDDAFGISVAVEGRTVVVGSYNDDIGVEGASRGSTYVFQSDAEETPPATIVELEPESPDGENAWYVSPVSARVRAVPGTGGSPVVETRCVLDPPAVPTSFDDLPADCPFLGEGGTIESEGFHVLWAASLDEEGDRELPLGVAVALDRSPPLSVIDLDPEFPDGESAWWVSPVRVSVSALALGGSAVSEIRCVVDPDVVPEAFDDLRPGCAFTGLGDFVEGDGEHVVYAASRDLAGHEEAVSSRSFAIDATPPLSTIAFDPAFPDGESGWWLSPVRVTVSATTDGASALLETRCVLDPASPPATFQDLAEGCPYAGGGAVVEGEGEHTIYAASRDRAGNEELPYSRTFGIDATPPETTIVLDPDEPDGEEGWYVTPPLLAITAEDGEGSGHAAIRCVVDPLIAPATFDDLPESCAWAGPGDRFRDDGVHTVYAASRDRAGNAADVASALVALDTTAPAVTCEPPDPATPTGLPTFLLRSDGGEVSASVVDAGSGAVEASVSTTVSPDDTGSPGVRSASVTGSDLAGNEVDVPCAYVVAYDLTVVSPTGDLAYRANGRVPLAFTLADASATPIGDAEAGALDGRSCAFTVLLDGIAQRGCPAYRKRDRLFAYDLRIPRETAPGGHTITLVVGAPDGTGPVNVVTIPLTVAG